jgi:hypothetical protein
MTTRPGIRDLVSTALAALVLSVLVWAGGCGRTEGLADRYRAERLAWQAMKLSRAMRTNPDLATDEMRGRLEDTYRAIIASFPPPGDPASMSDLERDVAEIAGRSRSGLALMALGRGDTGEAIRLYASLRDSYAFDPVLSREPIGGRKRSPLTRV